MFSGAIKLLDLNDYLAPKEECVVTLNGKKVTLESTSDEISLFQPKSAPPSKISLTDCLACSACVTSSEKILVEDQSEAKFRELVLKSERSFVLVTPQSLAVLGQHFGVSDRRILGALGFFLRQKFGTDFCLDLQAFIHLANEISFREFTRARKTGGKTLLTSECPGFVCYAEKVLDPIFVDMISKIKPPQILAARAVKGLCMNDDSTKPVLAVLVAACFDKKLEAAREEMKEKGAAVDLVLSSREFLQLLIAEGFGKFLQSAEETGPLVTSTQVLRQMLGGRRKWSEILQHGYKDVPELPDLLDLRIAEEFGESNGYLDYILQRLRASGDLAEVKSETKKEKKFVEITIRLRNGETLSMAIVYGFKNIQNLINQLKTKRKRYVYCEVMACPSGCIGGAGQFDLQLISDLAPVLGALRSRETAKPPLGSSDLAEKAAEAIENDHFGLILPQDFLFYELKSIKNAGGIKESW